MCRHRKQENGVISLFVITEVGEVFNKIQNLCLFPALLRPLTPPYKHEALSCIAPSQHSPFINYIIIYSVFFSICISYKSRTQNLEILFTQVIFFLPNLNVFKPFTLLLLSLQLVKKLNTFTHLLHYFLNAMSVKTALRK